MNCALYSYGQGKEELCIHRSDKNGRETRYVPCNRLSIQLLNSMLHCDQMAARGLRSATGRVLGKLCLIVSQQEFLLFP